MSKIVLQLMLTFVLLLSQIILPEYALGSGPPPPPPPGTVPAFTGSATGHTLLLSQGGTLTAWGNNEYGQCGYEGEAVGADNPYYFPKFAKITQVAAGGAHSLALDDEGKIWSWGNNAHNQLGRTTSDKILEKIDDFPLKIKQIAAGENHSVALDENGNVWTWGDNSYMQLGYGGTSAQPQMLDLPETAKFIAAGNNNTLIIGNSNKVYSCGDNAYGQLGDSDTIAPCSDLAVVKLPERLIVHKVALGSSHAIAYVEDESGKKSIYAWGNNRSHQLGVEGLEQSALPLEIYTSANITDIFAGNQRNIVEAGAEVCWGTGLAYHKPTTDDWTYDYTEDVLEEPTERNMSRSIIAVGTTETVARSVYEIEVNGSGEYSSYRLAVLSPTNDLYYSDLFNNPEYTICLNFIEFTKTALDATDIGIEYPLGGQVPYVAYVNSRECKIIFDRYSFNESQTGIISPQQSLSSYIAIDAITTNMKVVTNAIRLWYYGSSNWSIIPNNGETIVANEGSENGSIFYISINPVTHWKVFPFYSMGETNGVNGDWHLGMTFSNLPKGVTVSDMNFGENGLVWKKVTLSGNTLMDYDSTRRINITYLYQSLNSDISPNIKMSDVDKSGIYAITGYVEFTAVDDPENITISSDAPIILGKENGAKITAKISGGTFETSVEHNPDNWILVGAQDGVKVSSVKLVDNVTAELTLSGSSSNIYSSDNEIKLLCKGSEYSDSMDYTTMTATDLLSENAITFKKQTRPRSGNGGTTITIPTANPIGGTVVVGTKLVLTTPYSSGKIYYTTDATTPTANSTLYTGPIVLDKNMTVRYIVINDGRTSNVGSQTYTVRMPKVQLMDNASSIRYINGYADGTFKPDQIITRYEMIEYLNNILDIENTGTNKQFPDVSVQYKDAVDLFVGAGIIDGFDDGNFKGGQGLTRAEFVKIMATILNLDIKDAESNFSDTKGHWADKFIAAFSKLGYIKGYENYTFKPDKEISRAEFVAIINRILKVNLIDLPQKYTDLQANHWAYKDIMTVTQ